MEKIGVFGGTFNPVHKGHEITAVSFYDKFELSKLLIIPSNIPPHKKNDERISPQSRFEMCRICFEKHKGRNIEVSDIEIKKDGVSYSVDTLKALRAVYPENPVYFLVGSDMFLYLEKWRSYKEILKMCVFVVAYRNNADITEVARLRDKLLRQGYKTGLLENTAIKISSTELREKLKDGGSGLTEYLCPEILNYIKEKKIYVLQ